MLSLFVADNLGIFAGYLFIGFLVLPRASEYMARLIPFVQLRLRWTTIGGAVFFATCGLTHLEMAAHALLEPHVQVRALDLEWHMIIIHTVQVVSVYTLIAGTVFEFTRPVRRALRPVQPPAPTAGRVPR